MSNTPPSEPSPLLRVQTNLGKKKGDSKSEEAEEGNTRTNGNGGDAAAGTLMPFAGEMERRGEEKLLDERIRERYQKEIGDIFN